MNTTKNFVSISIFMILIMLLFFPIWPDGRFFSSRSVAVSADQRAILIKNDE